MSSNGQYQTSTPDLNTVLQTLAQLAPQNAKSAPPPDTSQETRGSHHDYGVHQYSYEPTNMSRTPSNPSNSNVPSSDPRIRSQTTLRPASTSSMAYQNIDKSRSATPTLSGQAKSTGPDPSTITEWPAALKYVMKTVSQNEAVQAKIKHLIERQHRYEREWWAGREALVAQQKQRSRATKQMDSDASTQADAAELSRFDAKVYKAQLDMARELDQELWKLKIPFYAIKHELVLTRADQKGGEWVLEKDELKQLQRRILELLEDLCKD